MINFTRMMTAEKTDSELITSSPFEIRNNCANPPSWRDNNGEIFNVDRIFICGSKYFWGKFAEKVAGQPQENKQWVQLFFFMSPVSESGINPNIMCSTFIKNKAITALADATVKASAKGYELKNLVWLPDFKQTTSKNGISYNYLTFEAEPIKDEEQEHVEKIIEFLNNEPEFVTKIPQLFSNPPLMVEYNGDPQEVEFAELILRGEGVETNAITGNSQPKRITGTVVNEETGELLPY